MAFKDIIKKTFKLKDPVADSFPTYSNPVTNMAPTNNVPAMPAFTKGNSEDPLLTAMNSAGQNPPTPPLAENTLIHYYPIGSRGTEIYAGYPREEYLHELFGKDRAKIFDKMRRSDSQCQMLLSAVKNSILSATWEVDPASDNPFDVGVAELIKHILFEDRPKRNGFQKTLLEALDMVDMGHSVLEKTYKLVQDHPRFGTYHGIAALDHISPKTIYRWNVDPFGELMYLTQIAIGDMHRYVNIPAEFLMVFSLGMTGANYEGISMLRPCYGPWLRKNMALKLNAIGIEKHAVPTPVVKIPPGFQEEQGYEFLVEALEDYTAGQSNYLIIHDNLELTLQANVYDPEKVDKAIDAEDRRMTKSFCANFLELGLSGSGSFALGEDLSDFFLSGIEHIADNICDGFNNDLIKELCNLNFGELQQYPKLRHSGITDKAGKELAEVMHFLTSSQVIVPDDMLEADIRKRYSFPEKSDIGQRTVAPTTGSGGGMGGGGGGGGGSAGASLSERIRKRWGK